MMFIWRSGIPPYPSDMESLRQALGANPKLKWTDIYDALANQYSGKKAAHHTEKSGERANAYIDKKDIQRKKESLRNKRDQAKPINGKANKFSKKHCDYCHQDSHIMKDCFSYQRAKDAAPQ